LVVVGFTLLSNDFEGYFRILVLSFLDRRYFSTRIYLSGSKYGLLLQESIQFIEIQNGVITFFILEPVA
jgi:hypothetical protein